MPWSVVHRDWVSHDRDDADRPATQGRGFPGTQRRSGSRSMSKNTMSSRLSSISIATAITASLDGASKIPDLFERAKALGMPALALTDHGNMYGAVEFLREAKAAEILPIVGLEAYVAPGRRTERSSSGGVSGQEHAFHLTLLAKNATGFRNLMRLSSLSFLEGFYYKPRIDKEILERHAEGLICLSGCASAEFSDYILHEKRAEAERLCARGIRRSSAKTASTWRFRTTGWQFRKSVRSVRSILPGGWACLSSPPATRTISPGKTRPCTTFCFASTWARRSTTRRG